MIFLIDLLTRAATFLSESHT